MVQLIESNFFFYLKGGQKVSPESVLCRIECEDQQIYDIKACIYGTIVEMNNKLIDNYKLLTQKVSYFII